MYPCGKCGSVSRSGEKIRRRVLAYREVTYPHRVAAHPPEAPGMRRRDDPGGVGWEIAREVPVCRMCDDHTVPVEPPRREAVSNSSSEDTFTDSRFRRLLNEEIWNFD